MDSVMEQLPTSFPATGSRTWCPLLRHPCLCAKAFKGSPPRFPPTHKQDHGSLPLYPSSDLLLATHGYYQHRLGSSSNNSSWGSRGDPGEVILHHPSLPKA